MEEVKIVVGKNGEVKIDVHGVKGGSCQEVTKELEAAFGSVVERRKTGEYYEEAEKIVAKVEKRIG